MDIFRKYLYSDSGGCQPNKNAIKTNWKKLDEIFYYRQWLLQTLWRQTEYAILVAKKSKRWH